MASGRIALSESAGLGMHPLTVPGLTPITAPFPSYHSPPPQSPPQPNLTMLWLPRRQVIKLLRSAPVNGTKPNEMRPLTYAVRLGRPRAVEALLKVRPPLAVHLILTLTTTTTT